MKQREFVLATLASAKGAPLTPVQLQKFLFILDRAIGATVRGSGFTFRPYHYGPFDRDVYSTMGELRQQDLAEISESLGALRTYRLTDAGEVEGRAIADAKLDQRSRDYASAVGNFVRSHSFASLVSSIYKAYPDMKVNSVFRE